jgi:dipeptidyl-peptidase-4
MRRRLPLVFITGLALAPACSPARTPSHATNVLGAAPRTSATSQELATAPDDLADRIRAFAATRGHRYGEPSFAEPTPDGKAVLFLRGAGRSPTQSLWELDLESGVARVLVDPEALVPSEEVSAAEKARRERQRIASRGIASFEQSEDGAHVLFVLGGRLYVHARKTGATRVRVAHPGVIDPHFSPDGKHVAFVRDHDVWVVGTEAGDEARVTRHGSEHKTNGLAEFVAQEELGRSRGFWWSPDSRHILYEEADTSDVERLALVDLARPEHAPERPAYPRAGRANARIRFGVVAVSGGETTWLTWNPSRFPYVSHVRWPKVGTPTVFVLDRAQRHGALLAFEPTTGRTHVLVDEHDELFLNHDPSVPVWLPDGRFLWSSEREGVRKLEVRKANGALDRVLTDGAIGYRKLASYDAARGVAYIEGGADPTVTNVVRVPLEQGAVEAIAGGPGEVVTANFGPAREIFTTSEASLGALAAFRVRKTDGTVVRTIESLAEPPSGVRPIEVTRVGEEGFQVAIVRPRGFEPARRYPVIDAAYGGPHHSVVTHDLTRFVRAQWIADRANAIVVAIDAQGTPNRGRDWERSIAGKFASVPVEGHVRALRALAAKYPEMDATRIGVYGWSFGGYFAALAALTRPDVYKVAVAGAPVVDWRDYDTCYTERYLGLPDANGEAYDAASLLTHAAKPSDPKAPSRPLLVVHGTSDDNVYFAHSLKLVDTLVRAGRPVDFLPLAATTHQVTDPVLVEKVWTKVGDYLRDGLRTHEQPR